MSMRVLFAVGLIGTIIVLIGVLTQSSRTMTTSSTPAPTMDGVALPIAALQESERVLLVVQSYWREEKAARQYQIEGGPFLRVGIKQLNPSSLSAEKSAPIVSGRISREEAVGLDAYLLYLRRGFSGSHGSDHVVVGYYRDGTKIGEERFTDATGILRFIRWQNGGVSRPSDISINNFPDEVFREIITPRVIEERLKAPNKTPEPTPGAVTPRATEGASR